jgi:membrane protease subunit HflK
MAQQGYQFGWRSWLPEGWPKDLRGLGAYYIALGVVGLVGLFTSFYTVEPDEQAVILRLGKYVSTEESGLHFKLPFFIDSATKVKTKLILQEEFGFRTKDSRGTGRSTYSQERFDEESLMVTGDLNVADVEWTVQFQISDPQKYLFGVRDPLTTLRDISHAVTRRVVGDRLVTDVLTVGRAEISAEATRVLQETMDRYDIGIRIVAVKLQDVNPPEQVKPSFNEVNSAKQEQEQMVNQAEKIYNKTVPEARGSAEKVVQEAQGYAASVVNRAKGDAEKLDAVIREYQKAPDITRRRMYLDAMQDVLSRVENLTVVDQSLKGVLPIYDSNKSHVVPVNATEPPPVKK